MSKTTALLKAGEEAKASLEEKLAIYADKLDYLQAKVESRGSKISDGNMAVKILEAKVEQLEGKIKLKHEVMRNQVRSCTQ
jgi:peptidoglycan hydrolase CwlO-like protein